MALVNIKIEGVPYQVEEGLTILEAAKEAGTEWVVVEQDKATMGLTPMESIAKSIEYLKTIKN